MNFVPADERHTGCTPTKVSGWTKSLHHPRKPGMMIPCIYEETMVFPGFKVVQDVVHLKYVVGV